VTSFFSFLLVLSQVHAKDAETCEVPNISPKKLSNSAFVFVKPHANMPATQDLVVDKLTKAGIQILDEQDFDGASRLTKVASFLINTATGTPILPRPPFFQPRISPYQSTDLKKPLESLGQQF
jgi:hypothetical protein